MLKKLLVSILLASFLLAAIFVPYVKAQEGGVWYNQAFGEWAVKVFDDSNPNEIFGERYTYAQVTWILHSLEAFSLGNGLINCVETTSGDLSELEGCLEGLKEKGSSLGPTMAIAAVADSVLSTQPASGVEYLADTASRLRIIPEAYAQGVGFRGLQPALIAWKITRNMTYALSVIAVVIIAFMIMFRVKISPQTVISVQSALPRIIIVLILITFSYAIAGLIIDLAYLSLGAVAMLIKSAGVNLTSLEVIEFFNRLVFSPGLLWGLVLTLLVFLVFWAIVGLAAGGLFTVVTGGTGAAPAIVGGVIGGILFLLLIIMILIASLKILWLLIKTTINILLLIIAAPIMILLGAFSTTVGFGSWLRSLIANVAVFPAVRLMLFLAHYFFWGLAATDANILAKGRVFNPLKIIPFGDNSPVLPGFLPFGETVGILGWMISFGVFFLTPKVGDIIKSMIEGKPFTYGTAIGEALGPVKAAGLYGTAKGLNVWEEVERRAGRPTPASVQTLRSLLGLKPR